MGFGAKSRVSSATSGAHGSLTPNSTSATTLFDPSVIPIQPSEHHLRAELSRLSQTYPIALILAILNARPTFLTLPTDILARVFSFCEPPTIATLARTCRTFAQIIKYDQLLWHTKLARPLPLPFGVTGEESGPRNRLSAREAFRKNWLTGVNWRSGNCRVRRAQREDVSVYFDLDERLVVSVALSEAAKIWNTDSGQTVFHLSGHEGQISAVKFDRNTLITASKDLTCKVWDRRLGVCTATLEGHTKEVLQVDFSDSLIATGSEDHTVRVWNFQGNELRCFVSHEEPVTCICLIDGPIIVEQANSGSDLDGAHENLEELQLDAEVTLLRNRPRLPSSCTPAPVVVSGSLDKTIKVWSVANGKSSPVATLRGHEGPVYCLQVEHDGQWDPERSLIISGSGDTTIKVWKGFMCVKTLRGHAGGVVCLQFDEHKIVSGSIDNSIKLWDRKRLEPLYTIQQHSLAVYSIRFNDSKLMSSSLDRSVIEYDFEFMDEKEGDEMTCAG